MARMEASNRMSIVHVCGFLSSAPGTGVDRLSRTRWSVLATVIGALLGWSSLQAAEVQVLADPDWQAQVAIIKASSQRLATNPDDQEARLDAIAALTTLSWSLDGYEWAPPGPFQVRALALVQGRQFPADDRINWYYARSGQMGLIQEPKGDRAQAKRAWNHFQQRDWRPSPATITPEMVDITGSLVALADCGMYPDIDALSPFEQLLPRGLREAALCNSPWLMEGDAPELLLRACFADAEVLVRQAGATLPGSAQLAEVFSTAAQAPELSSTGATFGRLLATCQALRIPPNQAGQLVSQADLAHWLLERSIHAGWQAIRVNARDHGVMAVRTFIAAARGAGGPGIAIDFLDLRNAVEKSGPYDPTMIQRLLAEIRQEAAYGEHGLAPSFRVWSAANCAKAISPFGKDGRDILQAVMPEQEQRGGWPGIIMLVKAASVVQDLPPSVALLKTAREADPESFGLAACDRTYGSAVSSMPVSKIERILRNPQQLGALIPPGPCEVSVTGEFRTHEDVIYEVRGSGPVEATVDGRKLFVPGVAYAVSGQLTKAQEGWHRFVVRFTNQQSPAQLGITLSQGRMVSGVNMPPMMTQGGMIQVLPGDLRGPDGKPGLEMEVRLAPKLPSDERLQRDFSTHAQFADRPWRFVSRLALAESHWEQGDRQEAKKQLDALVAEAPTYTEALLFHAFARAEMGEPEPAIAALDAVAGKLPVLQRASVLRMQSDLAWNNADFTLAKTYAASAAETGQAFSILFAADRCVALGDYGTAARHFAGLERQYREQEYGASAVISRYLAGTITLAELTKGLARNDEVNQACHLASRMHLGVLARDGEAASNKVVASFPGVDEAVGVALLAAGHPVEAKAKMDSLISDLFDRDAYALSFAVSWAWEGHPQESYRKPQQPTRHGWKELATALAAPGSAALRAVPETSAVAASARLCAALRELKDGKATAAGGLLASVKDDPRDSFAVMVCRQLAKSLAEPGVAARFADPTLGQ